VDPRSRRAREIQSSIDAILFHDWDPIGVKDEPACRDEYACCVGWVYRGLASGASEQEIAALLRRIEIDHLGLSSTDDQLAVVARKLRALDVRLS
jgi:hypothetical protein